jgi:CheY-like chemotaxis protein
VIPDPQTDQPSLREVQVVEPAGEDAPSSNGHGTTLHADVVDAATDSSENQTFLEPTAGEMPEGFVEADQTVAQEIPADVLEVLRETVEPATVPEPRFPAEPKQMPSPANVRTNSEHIGSSDGPNPRARKTVLVIDDDATMRMLLRLGLRSHDYDCLTAENGKVAQELLETNRPDLILVDLLMPVMDGLTFLHWLRKTARNATPVLVFTNMNTPNITQEALASGANAFAYKPLHLRELLEAITKLVPS